MKTANNITQFNHKSAKIAVHRLIRSPFSVLLGAALIVASLTVGSTSALAQFEGPPPLTLTPLARLWQGIFGEPLLRPTQSHPPKTPGAPDVTLTFDIVAYPGVDAMQVPRGINDKGHIVGRYVDQSSLQQGFLLQKTTFKPIAVPGTGVTTAPWAINKSGVVVGRYTADQGTSYHGFILKNNTYTTVDYPGAVFTGLTGISASGVMVGEYFVQPNVYHGFLLNGGVFATIDFPSAVITEVSGINSSGEMVGVYEVQDRTLHGFTLVNGTYTTLDYPGAIETDLTGIADGGDIIGTYSTDTGATYITAFYTKTGAFTSPSDIALLEQPEMDIPSGNQ